MSDEGKLLAVQLANQRLAESRQTLQAENEKLQEEKGELTEQVARLQGRLKNLERLHEELKSEYKRSAGNPYQGRMETTKFGFGRPD
jgi:chromosome segregation ATPase